MKIVFFGSTELGYECCEKLILGGQKVVGIFTIPKEFRISYSPGKPIKNYLFRDFTELGSKYKIPVFTVEGKLSDYANEVDAMKPDFMLAAGWYYMIPKSIRQIAAKGCAALHASLLPKYRGNAPLVWAMINGESETGVTLFYLEDEADAGDVIGQVRFSIEENDTIRDLIEKCREGCLQLLTDYIPGIENGTAPRSAQKHNEATIYPNRTPDDGLIDWNWDTQRIRNFIRAQTKPYPGAFTVINNKKVTLWDADIADI